MWHRWEFDQHFNAMQAAYDIAGKYMDTLSSEDLAGMLSAAMIYEKRFRSDPEQRRPWKDCHAAMQSFAFLCTRRCRACAVAEELRMHREGWMRPQYLIESAIIMMGA